MKSRLRHTLEVLCKRVVAAEEEAIPSDEGLTPSRAAVLAAIVQVGRRQGVSGIARLLGVTQPYTTSIVQELEAMGLIHRIQREGHKVHSILLTPEGATVLSLVERSEERVLEKVLAALSAEERVVFDELLRRVTG